MNFHIFDWEVKIIPLWYLLDVSEDMKEKKRCNVTLQK